MSKQSKRNATILKRFSLPLGRGGSNRLSEESTVAARPSDAVREALSNLIEHQKPWQPRRLGQ